MKKCTNSGRKGLKNRRITQARGSLYIYEKRPDCFQHTGSRPRLGRRSEFSTPSGHQHSHGARIRRWFLHRSILRAPSRRSAWTNRPCLTPCSVVPVPLQRLSNHVPAHDVRISPSQPETQHEDSCGEIGAGEEIRTPDQRLGKPMRYHCATPARKRRKVVRIPRKTFHSRHGQKSSQESNKRPRVTNRDQAISPPGA